MTHPRCVLQGLIMSLTILHGFEQIFTNFLQFLDLLQQRDTRPITRRRLAIEISSEMFTSVGSRQWKRGIAVTASD